MRKSFLKQYAVNHDLIYVKSFLFNNSCRADAAASAVDDDNDSEENTLFAINLRENKLVCLDFVYPNTKPQRSLTADLPEQIGITLNPDQIALSTRDKLDQRARNKFMTQNKDLLTSLESILPTVEYPRLTGQTFSKHFTIMSYVPIVRSKLNNLVQHKKRFMLLLVVDSGWIKRAKDDFRIKFEEMVKKFAHREFIKKQAKVSLWIPVCEKEDKEPIERWTDALTRSIYIDYTKKSFTLKGDLMECKRLGGRKNNITICLSDNLTTINRQVIWPESLLAREAETHAGTLKGPSIRKSDVRRFKCDPIIKKPIIRRKSVLEIL